MSDIDELLDELELNSPASTPTDAVKAASLSGFPNSSNSSPERNLANQTSSLGKGCQSGVPGIESNYKKAGAGNDLLDDLLDDLDCVDSCSPELTNGAGRADSNSSGSVLLLECHRGTGVQGSGSSRKCFPVCLAGSRDEHGISPGRGCDNLRCTKCDFQVLRVDDHKWSDDAEYLFFRNFYPNLDKLRPKLVKNPGGSCYACQCTWRSVTELSPLGKAPDMRWVCGGHR